MENVDETAQDYLPVLSPCPRVDKKGRYSRTGDFGIDATDAVIGLRSMCASRIIEL